MHCLVARGHSGLSAKCWADVRGGRICIFVYKTIMHQLGMCKPCIVDGQLANTNYLWSDPGLNKCTALLLPCTCECVHACVQVNSKTELQIQWHGALMSVAWVLLLPIGAILPRHRWGVGANVT